MKLNAKGIIIRSNQLVGDFFPVEIVSNNMDPGDGYMEFSIQRSPDDVIFSTAVYFAPGVVVDERLWPDWFEYFISIRKNEYIPNPRRQKQFGVNRITTRECVGNIVFRLHRDDNDIIILIDDTKLVRKRNVGIDIYTWNPRGDINTRTVAKLSRNHIRVIGSEQIDKRTTKWIDRGVFNLVKPLDDADILQCLISGKTINLGEMVRSEQRPNHNPVFVSKNILGFRYAELSDGNQILTFGKMSSVYNELIRVIIEYQHYLTIDQFNQLFSLIQNQEKAVNVESAFALLQSLAEKVTIDK